MGESMSATRIGIAGSVTTFDSSRFRHALAEATGYDPQCTNA